MLCHGHYHAQVDSITASHNISRPTQIGHKHSLSLRGKIGLGLQEEHTFLCHTPQNVISRAKGIFYNFILSSFKSCKRREKDYEATFFFISWSFVFWFLLCTSFILSSIAQLCLDTNKCPRAVQSAAWGYIQKLFPSSNNTAYLLGNNETAFFLIPQIFQLHWQIEWYVSVFLCSLSGSSIQ